MPNLDPTLSVPEQKAALRRSIRADRRERRRTQDTDARTVESRAIAAAVLGHLDASPAAAEAGWGTHRARVAVFRSTPSEPDTTALIAALHERGVTVLVPRTRADMHLEWHELFPEGSRPTRDAGVAPGRFGAEFEPEPGYSADGDAPTDPTGVAPSDPTPDEGSREVSSSAELPSTDDTDDEGPSLGTDAVADITAMVQPGLAVDTAGHRLGQGGGCYDRTIPLLRPGTVRAVLLFDDEVLDAVPFDEHDALAPAVVTPGSGWRDLI